MPHLTLDSALVDEARAAASRIARPVLDLIAGHTTVAIERTVLRLIGVDGVDSVEVPLPNVIVEHARALLPGGILAPFAAAMLQTGLEVQPLAQAIATGAVQLAAVSTPLSAEVRAQAERLAYAGVQRIRARRRERDELLASKGNPPQPWIYVIVATGNIYEDIVQAKAAARQGADIIAVIRSTAQSLLDYVPYGATTEGFGGTYATQENFRLMRAALDEVSAELGRYVRLTNYCSGLCMPEIAAMGALERLDMMLNDALYGIIFRDINMQRTLIDQHFSRRINAAAGIIINTGEDNYLTTADALQSGHTVIASQFLNERLALEAGLPEEQIGLGHAFEINPDTPNHLLYEIASAQLIRDLFPRSPIKYMPPTKHMTGDIFRGHLLDSFFNLVGALTGQGIQLLGMPTEAIHTPLLQDRFVSIRAARYTFDAARDLGKQFTWYEDSLVAQRANELLRKAVELLHQFEALGGLFNGLSQGLFADIRRAPDGGRGLEGVIARSSDYYNPFYDLLTSAVRGEKEAEESFRRYLGQGRFAGHLDESESIWPHPWPILLLPYPSGVTYEMQCGGLACHHRYLEGIYLPVFGVYDQAFPERLESLHPGCGLEPITPEEADKLDAIFAEFSVPLKVARARLFESYEAWVHVEISQPNANEVLGNFGGSSGILIWRNCD